MNYDIGKRYDGFFNVWQQVTIFDEKDGFSEYWQIIGVYYSEKIAKTVVTHLKEIQDFNGIRDVEVDWGEPVGNEVW